MMKEYVRINKYISENGILSRRKTDEYIRQGRITVNGITITEPGFMIKRNIDKINIDGEPVRVKTKKIYILLNKPPSVITTVEDEKKRKTVIDLINIKDRIFPVGRLDYETTGILILTNDGDFAYKLMHPKFEIRKTYIATLSREIEDKHIDLLQKGILLEGKRTKPCVIRLPEKQNRKVVSITISEGKNRQVRNMFEKFGYFVRKLHRIEYGNLKLKGLPEGEWRFLTKYEIENLVK